MEDDRRGVGVCNRRRYYGRHV